MFKKRKCHAVVSSYSVVLDGVQVQVSCKRIKTMRLSVRPPDAQVKLSVPIFVGEFEVRAMLQEKLAWIHEQRERVFARVKKQRAEVGGQGFLWGRPCVLQRVDCAEKVNLHGIHSRNSLGSRGKASSAAVEVIDKGVGLVTVRIGAASDEQMAQVFDLWCRQQLSACIVALLDEWQPVVDRCVSHWQIRKMRTRWGSCNIRDKRISISFSLVHYPKDCLRFVLVHELVHLHERLHSARFYALMDKFLPDWREADQVLKAKCYD